MRNIKRIGSWLVTAALLSGLALFGWMLDERARQPETADAEPPGEAEPANGSAPTAPLSRDYVTVAENDVLRLQLKASNLSIRVEDKRSGYVWSSEIEQVEANESWKQFMASGLSIEVFEGESANAKRYSFVPENDATAEVERTEDGFRAAVRFPRLGIGMEFEARLDGDELVVQIPQQSIAEEGKARLASVFVFPFLGATHAGDIEGYLFVPDGSGGLIRFADNKGKFRTPYSAKIYGTNAGLEPDPRHLYINEPYTVQFPVFGIVHGERRHALFAEVESGQHNANIVAYPNGVNTPYNWATAQFLARESYLQPTSRSLGGIVVYEKNRHPEDIRIRYAFLHGEDAGYAGMARTYRQRLVDRGVLVRQRGEAGGTEDIPLHLDVLGAETENSLFGKRLVPMTTVRQLEAMLDDLEQSGVRRVNAVFRGWNEGGLSGTNPSPIRYEKSLGTAADFRRVADALESRGGRLYLYRDYTVAYDESRRFSARSDAATRIDRQVLALPTYRDVYDRFYYMSAEHTLRIVSEDVAAFARQGVDGVAVDHTGHVLFSEWKDGAAVSRKQTADAYREAMSRLAERLSSVLLYAPNDYMLAYADAILQMPLETSGYTFVGESVPFAQMVLKGYKDVYASHANFDANPADGLLRMIESGSFPSFYVTAEPSHKLKFTNSNDVYTSSYDDWRGIIVDTYRTMNEALKPVRYAAIEDRIRLDDGVYRVVYDNGASIVVNYTEEEWRGDGYRVPAKGFVTIGGSGR